MRTALLLLAVTAAIGGAAEARADLAQAADLAHVGDLAGRVDLGTPMAVGNRVDAAAVDTLAVGSGSGSRGTDVTVPLGLRNFDPIKAIQFDLHFDPSVVAFAGIAPTDRVGAMALSYALAREDTLRVVMYYDDATELPPGDGAVANLTFLVVGSEGARSDLTPAEVKLAGSAPQPIPSASAAGQIEVVAGSGEVPEVRLIAPNGGEVWPAGSVQSITWTASDPDTPSEDLRIALELSTDGGSNWSPIASGEENDGSFAWTLPDVESAEARVRADASDGSRRMWDESDAVFEIVFPDPLELVLSVLKNPGRIRTLQIVVWASRPLDAPPQVHAGLLPVAMTQVPGLEAYEGRAFLGSGTRTVDVIAHGVSGPRERTVRTTVGF